jgi:hypothetical protein
MSRISLSSSCSIIPTPRPPPDSKTVDAIAAAAACDADGEGEEILLQIFSFKRVHLLDHDLPPPTESSLLSAVSSCVKNKRLLLAAAVLATACSPCAVQLMNAKVCRIFADGVLSAVATARCSPASARSQLQAVYGAVEKAAREESDGRELRECLRALDDAANHI